MTKKSASCLVDFFRKVASGAPAAPRKHVVEHRVYPVRNFGSVEMPKEHTRLEFPAETGRLPPRRSRRPRDAIACVERLYGRKKLVGESARYERELIRHRPVQSTEEECEWMQRELYISMIFVARVWISLLSFQVLHTVLHGVPHG